MESYQVVSAKFMHASLIRRIKLYIEQRSPVILKRRLQGDKKEYNYLKYSRLTNQKIRRLKIKLSIKDRSLLREVELEFCLTKSKPTLNIFSSFLEAPRLLEKQQAACRLIFR